jgi:uncharacterized membrane protein YjgN (DUF898 family)
MQDIPQGHDVGAGTLDNKDSLSVATIETESQAPQAGPEKLPFRFTGNAAEFFGIWIVNLFLTIVTLGIYSAWAKVRKKRYFYGHTWVADANFEYHGNPIAILKGRLIALAVFAIYSGVAHFMPQVAIVLAILLFAVAPWFIARSMAFNAFNSSYRNIRFRFHATYLDVFKAIAPMGVVLAISFFMPAFDPKTNPQPPAFYFVMLGLQMASFLLLYPYVVGALKRLHVNHSQFGTSTFATSASIGDFYKIFFLTAGLLIVAAGLVGIVSSMLAMLGKIMAGVGIFLGIVTVYFGVLPMMIGYSQSRTANLVFNKTRLGESISFVSTLKARKLAVLYLTNLLAILFSFGLAIPWAVIRSARYRLECLALETRMPIEQFVSGIASDVSATGEELGEFFNIDLSL